MGSLPLALNDDSTRHRELGGTGPYPRRRYTRASLTVKGHKRRSVYWDRSRTLRGTCCFTGVGGWKLPPLLRPRRPLLPRPLLNHRGWYLRCTYGHSREYDVTGAEGVHVRDPCLHTPRTPPGLCDDLGPLGQKGKGPRPIPSIPMPPLSRCRPMSFTRKDRQTGPFVDVTSQTRTQSFPTGLVGAPPTSSPCVEKRH